MDTQQMMSPGKCEQLPGGLGRLRVGLNEEGPHGVTQVSLFPSGHFSPVELFNSRNSWGKLTDFICSAWFGVFSRAQHGELLLLWLPISPLATLLYIPAIPASRSWLGFEPPLQEQRYPALSCDRGGGGKVAGLQGTGHKLPSRMGTHLSDQENNFKPFGLFFFFLFLLVAFT